MSLDVLLNTCVKFQDWYMYGCPSVDDSVLDAITKVIMCDVAIQRTALSVCVSYDDVEHESVLVN